MNRAKLKREIEESVNADIELFFYRGYFGMVEDVFDFKDELLKKKVGRKKK